MEVELFKVNTILKINNRSYFSDLQQEYVLSYLSKHFAAH